MTSRADPFVIRDAVLTYLRRRYGAVDLTWHPLFTAARELFAYLLGD